ncbi:MAG: hypothetical protein ABSC54_00735 [Smithellaceae bacterium]|jgi:hypothetical protein
MKQKRFYLSWLLIITMLFLISACSKGDPTDSSTTPPVLGTDVKAWTIKGDMAWELANQWAGSENDGVKGAKIKLFLDNPDARLLWPNKAVLFLGASDLTGAADQDLTQIIIDWATVFWSIKGETFGVSIPLNTPGKDQAKIAELNAAIKSICGTEHYVDTSAMTLTFDVDGHLDAASNAQIQAKILLMAAAI